MYRPRKAKAARDDSSLDSLMDVLSCAVGVMLFIVIFAVIEARGTSVLIYAPPLLREPPVQSERILVLAGCRFDGERGLEGHSDADAIAHACSDALLGAAGLGDIGMHFPDTDPAWKGADSLTLLGEE